MIDFKPMVDAIVFLAVVCLILLVALIGCVVWIIMH